jgi:hypothetical protein
MGMLSNVQDKLHLENKAFAERLDKIKRDKEKTVTQTVHITSALQERVITQLEVRLRN